jgi:hypothetical protein
MMSAGEGVVLVLLVLLLLLLCFVASLPRSRVGVGKRGCLFPLRVKLFLCVPCPLSCFVVWPSKLMLCLPIVKRSELFSAGLFAESGLFLPSPLFRFILSSAEAGTGSETFIWSPLYILPLPCVWLPVELEPIRESKA